MVGWNGQWIYRHLFALDIPVDIYAPYGTPRHQLTGKFLNHGGSKFEACQRVRAEKTD